MTKLEAICFIWKGKGKYTVYLSLLQRTEENLNVSEVLSSPQKFTSMNF